MSFADETVGIVTLEDARHCWAAHIDEFDARRHAGRGRTRLLKVNQPKVPAKFSDFRYEPPRSRY